MRLAGGTGSLGLGLWIGVRNGLLGADRLVLGRRDEIIPPLLGVLTSVARFRARVSDRFGRFRTDHSQHTKKTGWVTRPVRLTSGVKLRGEARSGCMRDF